MRRGVRRRNLRVIPVRSKNEPRVILLEGTSSSRKTTLARALQSHLDGVYLCCSLDAFWDMTPPSIPAGSVNFPKMRLAMAKSVRALAETGHNVIADITCNGLKPHSEFLEALAGIMVFSVKVSCPLSELERRELARGDRRIGLAKSQFALMREPIPFDLEVDTSLSSPSECAEKIRFGTELIKLRGGAAVGFHMNPTKPELSKAMRHD